MTALRDVDVELSRFRDRVVAASVVVLLCLGLLLLGLLCLGLQGLLFGPRDAGAGVGALGNGTGLVG